MLLGLYVHIPFCRSKCPYCPFISSVAWNEELLERYVHAVIREINLRNDEFGYSWDTVYLGGGTPSVLTENLLGTLAESIFKKNCVEVDEFTVEVNPEDVSPSFVKLLKSIGVNRVSVGIQRMNDGFLSFLGRHHSTFDNIKAVSLLVDAGFNVSIDFIFGLPDDTPNDVLAELKTAVSLGANHVSVYGLSVEEKTRLFVEWKKGKLKLPDDESYSSMYLSIKEFLSSMGFVHYEISNYARPSFESRHNLKYWNREPYEGIGVSASGFDGVFRYTNTFNLSSYIKDVLSGNKPESFREHLSSKQILEETVFLSLRKVVDGIDVSRILKLIDETYGSRDAIDRFMMVLESLREKGFLIRRGDKYFLSKKGLVVADGVSFELVKVLDGEERKRG